MYLLVSAIIVGAVAKTSFFQQLSLQQRSLSKLTSQYGIDLSGFTSEELVYYKQNLDRHLLESDSTDDIHSLILEAAPVQTVNSLATLQNEKPGWESGLTDRFRGMSIRDAKKMMGTFLEGPNAKRLDDEFTNEDCVINEDELPINFDAREKWSQCKTIGHIRDQGSCGSCWAHGSTEAFNDRMCIASNGKMQDMLSAQQVTSCCNLFHGCLSFGCNGGNPMMAWAYLTLHGAVTGGDYDDMGKDDTCWPYELPFCAHGDKDNKKFPQCSGDLGRTPKCESKCINDKYKKNSFEKDLHYGGYPYMVFGERAIKEQLFTKGSVTAAFTVYADFLLYKGGIYEHKSGAPLGGHAVKIMGYGTDNGVDYWLVANSWNTSWGADGFFKIKRGDSGINYMITAGTLPTETESIFV